MFLNRLKTLLRFDQVSGLFLYISFALILLYLSFIYPIVFIPLIFYAVFIYKKQKVLFIYLLIFLVIFSLVYILYVYFFSLIKVEENIIGVVTDKRENYILVKHKTYFIKLYTKYVDDFELGDKIDAKISLYSTSERHTENLFSYTRYKYSKRIVSEGVIKKLISIEKPFNIPRVKGYILNYIDKYYSEESAAYLKQLILGVNEMPGEFEDKINEIGIIYLFCISGLHISILKSGIKRILELVNIPEEIVSIIIVIILLFYGLIVSSSVSITRSIVCNIIAEFCLLINKKITKTDILSYTLFINLLINPLQFFTLGFYLTYLSTLVIYLVNNKKKGFLTSLIVISFSIPIILHFNHKISLFIVIYSVFFNLIFSHFFIPFSYLTVLFWPLGKVYHYLVIILNKVIMTSSLFNLSIEFSIASPLILILIYYLLTKIFKGERKIKNVGIMIALLMLNFLSTRYVMFPKVIILDVDQGDSILIRDGFKNILIDTGNQDDYNTTIEYLKSNNIHTIDALFISHDDFDHMGEEDDIKYYIKVNNTYRALNNQQFKYGHLLIKAYKMEESRDINEGSMILELKIFKERYLFTGDIEEAGEKYAIKNIEGNIDYLKVAHHGSASSSCQEFLEHFRPHTALVSVGERNTYGHPSADVIKRLERNNINIYRTDLDGKIELNHFGFFTYLRCYNTKWIYPFSRYKKIRFIFI